MIYLAIDPGLATGIAWLAMGKEDARFRSDIIESDWYDVPDLVWNAIEKHGPDGLQIIMEGFEIRKNTHQLSNQQEPRDIIGAVKWVCRRFGVPLTIQSAGMMKKFNHTPNNYAKVKQLGWYKPGPGHDNDATGHLISYLVNNPSPAGQWLRQELTR
jgi:hypothetical protein